MMPYQGNGECYDAKESQRQAFYGRERQGIQFGRFQGPKWCAIGVPKAFVAQAI